MKGRTDLARWEGMRHERETRGKGDQMLHGYRSFLQVTGGEAGGSWVTVVDVTDSVLYRKQNSGRWSDEMVWSHRWRGVT